MKMQLKRYALSFTAYNGEDRPYLVHSEEIMAKDRAEAWQYASIRAREYLDRDDIVAELTELFSFDDLEF